MQTFLPYSDFEASAKCLDNKRLGKQRVECLQLLQVLKKGPYICGSCKKSWEECELTTQDCALTKSKKKTPWYNHSACKMWQGHERTLILYGLAVCVEWISRGFKDTCYDKLQAIEDEINPNYRNVINPPWIGDEHFHISHRSNLLRKGCEDVTFNNLAGINGFPAKKKDWTIEHYKSAWVIHGKPVNTHYTKFGWAESDDLPYVWP